MEEQITDKLKKSERNTTNDHMANERTFLSWIRTAIAIMAFGFVVEKFSLFLNQITQLMSNVKSPLYKITILPHPSGYSSLFGVFLVILGGITCLLAFCKYKKTEKEIEAGTYFPSALLDVMLTMALLLVGLALTIYLVISFI